MTVTCEHIALISLHVSTNDSLQINLCNISSSLINQTRKGFWLEFWCIHLKLSYFIYASTTCQLWKLPPKDTICELNLLLEYNLWAHQWQVNKKCCGNYDGWFTNYLQKHSLSICFSFPLDTIVAQSAPYIHLNHQSLHQWDQGLLCIFMTTNYLASVLFTLSW